jgi:5-methylcytosine-specific restriction endonuclease McrBC GTP-binding regulatory subunit McrB
LATLPYSNEKFGVPANLYIVGTMNTSDRSIASVDIALRRRFKFKEIMPDSKLVIAEIDGVKFKEIFEALNEKITILLDRDDQIGHSFFMPDKVMKYGLKNIWFDEILPLLNEYFYNDWEKLQALLGKATNDNSSFVIEKNYTYEFVNDDINENKLFNFVNKKDIDNDDKFKIALSKILKDTKKEIYNNDN